MSWSHQVLWRAHWKKKWEREKKLQIYSHVKSNTAELLFYFINLLEKKTDERHVEILKLFLCLCIKCRNDQCWSIINITGGHCQYITYLTDGAVSHASSLFSFNWLSNPASHNNADFEKFNNVCILVTISIITEC